MRPIVKMCIRDSDEEDAGSEPACGSLARVWVTRRELAIHLDASDETHHPPLVLLII